MSNTWRVSLLLGSIARLSYGAGLLFAPVWMAEHFAPMLQDHPDPRMNFPSDEMAIRLSRVLDDRRAHPQPHEIWVLRGGGGAHSALAIYTLATTGSPARARTALRLNALVDALNAGASLLQWRAGGNLDQVPVASAIEVAGLFCWIAAAAGLRRHPSFPLPI